MLEDTVRNILREGPACKTRAFYQEDKQVISYYNIFHSYGNRVENIIYAVRFITSSELKDYINDEVLK